MNVQSETQIMHFFIFQIKTSTYYISTFTCLHTEHIQPIRPQLHKDPSELINSAIETVYVLY